MFTFSQMVDEIISEVKRPDLISEICRYVNQTIRECHFSTDRQAAIFFKENFNELLLTATSESGQTWEVPNPTTFQKMAGVKFITQLDSAGFGIWANETVPGRHLNGLEHYFYQVGGSFVFSGYGGVGAQIGLGYFAFPPSLKYKAEAVRPATYDAESGWAYNPAITTDEDKEAARLVSTNWLLMRWSDVVSEGVRAKVFKRVSDTERARNCYSLYGQLRQGLMTSDLADVGGIR
jgi:hypothetical protein